MRVLRRLLPKGRLRRAVVILTTGTAFGQLLVLIASPLLTRLYTPEDFGVLGVFSALLMVFGIAVSLCYELAIPLAEDDARMVNLLALSLVLALLVSSLFGVSVWLWGDLVTGWLNTEALRPLLWLLPVGLLAMGCNRALTHWAIRRQEFGDNHAHANQPERRSGHDPDWLRRRRTAAVRACVRLGLDGGRPVRPVSRFRDSRPAVRRPDGADPHCIRASGPSARVRSSTLRRAVAHILRCSPADLVATADHRRPERRYDPVPRTASGIDPLRASDPSARKCLTEILDHPGRPAPRLRRPFPPAPRRAVAHGRGDRHLVSGSRSRRPGGRAPVHARAARRPVARRQALARRLA